jgi:VWFA-related protein
MSRVLVISLIACLATVSTQERGPVQSPGAQTPIFSSSAELVVAHVTVKDRQGAYVTSLPEEAFRVFEDGTPQRIDFFTGEDSPVTVGFLVDSSGSMREGRERVIAAATAFAEASNRQDELFALAFNENVRAALPPSAPFTNDATVFRAALAKAMGAQAARRCTTPFRTASPTLRRAIIRDGCLSLLAMAEITRAPPHSTRC